MAGLIIIPALHAFSLLFEGIIWIYVPILCVVTNDCMAYFFGSLLGKKLIKYKFLDISPKKTWEGFIFGGIATIILSVIWA